MHGMDSGFFCTLEEAVFWSAVLWDVCSRVAFRFDSFFLLRVYSLARARELGGINRIAGNTVGDGDTQMFARVYLSNAW